MNNNYNPLRPVLSEFFARLNSLNGLLLHLANQLTNFRTLFRESWKEHSLDPSLMFAGFALCIRDLTLRPGQGFIEGYFPTGKFATQGEQYLEIVEVLLSRESAWAVAQAFEAFETYIYDTAALYLHTCPKKVAASVQKKHDSTLRKKLLTPSDTAYWKELVRKEYRSNPDMLEFLRKLAPELKAAETLNSRQIELPEWYIAVTEIRHAVTHSNMLIKPHRIRSWSVARRKLLSSHFPVDNLADGYKLKLEVKNAESNMELFGEYGFAIFKCLSEIEGYDTSVS